MEFSGVAFEERASGISRSDQEFPGVLLLLGLKYFEGC